MKEMKVKEKFIELRAENFNGIGICPSNLCLSWIENRLDNKCFLLPK